jgi:hypothetical protein
MNLIRRAFWLGFRHKDDAVTSRAEASNSRQASTKMGDYSAVHNNGAIGIGSKNSTGLQGDLSHPIQQAIEGSIVEVDERRIPAGYRGNAAANAGDGFYNGWAIGRLGHDLTPLFWDANGQCWRKLKESSRA